MVVTNNLEAMNANRNFNLTGLSRSKHGEKLSSGYRINRAADDAAGLTISEKMRSQIRGLTQASDNAQDGVSFCQIADGALDEVHDMLKRCQELSIQSSNGTNTNDDRAAIQAEIEAISKEIDRVHESSVFNELRVFPDSGNNPDVVMSGDEAIKAGKLTREVVAGNTVITLEFIGNTGSPAQVQEVKTSGTTNPGSVKNSAMASFVVDAAANAITKLTDNFPQLFAGASSENIQIGLELSSQGKGSTLATASISLSSGSAGTIASYKLWVDTADYPVDKFDSMSDAKKADLAATISHEMTHLIMYDTVTGGMFENKPSSFPEWFVEGMAQTSSGDNGWMSNRIQPGSSDASINDFKAKLLTMPYGAGYAASMYLGHVAGGQSTVTSEGIADGLDKLLTKIAQKLHDNPNSTTVLDDAIKEATNNKFSSVADFQSKFMSAANTDSLNFMKDLLAARGTSGAGSILGDLNKSEAQVFAPDQIPAASGNNYKVNKDNTWYSNAFAAGLVFPENLPSTGNGGGGQGNDRDGFILQVGAANKSEQQIFVKQFNISNDSLFDGMKMDASTIESARETIKLAQDADAKISAVRSYYGAMQNRLEHTIANLDNVVENTTAAESLIRDTDMASEMAAYTKDNILLQTGQAMLAQANQSKQGILQLLQ